MEQKNHTRRGALGRMLAVALGAAGAGALAESKTSNAQGAATLTLSVTDLRQKQVGVAKTVLPFGAIADARGREIGAFHTALVDSTGGALTMHTFELHDGTIVGIGSNDSYTVLGGTGAYAGVSGVYQQRSAARLPGRQFTFSFREGTHGRS